jgi:hypothetical protein
MNGLEFPSPCGEMGMKHDIKCSIWVFKPGDVSVPLWGNGYETRWIKKSSVRAGLRVSVPLWGNGYETLRSELTLCLVVQLLILFPSPCGEMGMKL